MKVSDRHMPGTYGFAVLGLTLLATTSSGALVAVLSFAAQLHSLVPGALRPFMVTIAALTAALFLTIIAATLAYFSENQFENGANRPPARVWALGFYSLGVGSLALGLGCAVITAVVQMRP